MNLQDLGKNRIVMIVLVAAIIGGYMFIRESRTRMEERMEKERPQFLTEEFARTRMEEASGGDKETAYRLLSDAGEYMESRQFREAGSAYHRAIALYPDGRVYYEYARYLFGMNKLTMMEDSLELASAFGYDPALIDFENARLYGKLNQPYEAFEYLKAAVSRGRFTPEEIEKERAFDVIRKSVMTKRDYAEYMENF